MHKYYKLVLIPSLIVIAIPLILSFIDSETFGNMATYSAYIAQAVIVYDVVAVYMIKKSKKKEAI